ncbi:transcript variant X2 [Nothobranchius furzeri]|uniref:Cysteine protease n=1 Tax=Nothobranchius furzeri TaxID=105023 RepID=A0A9D2XII9_NOTFU|nr:cysteine protease ATG4C isoform X2 [Nothobranchius furzeri]KAF7202695.1 transcript variant X2 [Nothobranchius furzeri]
MENKGSDEVEKLKTKFMSAWHNVKYSWALKLKTSFSRDSPVFLLGKCYHFKAEDDDCFSQTSCEASGEDCATGNVEAFRKDFASRVWLTYREDFAPLPGSTLTSDCGWGCMLRAGQMMLAQALVLHFLGRGQNPGSAEEADAHLKEMNHRTLVSWFGDTSSAPLGLHRFVYLGQTMGKQAGDWYGPSVVAHILKKAVKKAMDPGLAGITAYVSQDCTVYSADVLDCHKAPRAGETPDDTPRNGPAPQPTPPNNRAVVILVPVRLGGERTNPVYFEFAKSVLSLEYCIGIIGGKPKQACYFVGFQDDSLIYMDPHYCQSFVNVSSSDFSLQSFHCPSPKKMPFSKMDPSCTIGFYSRSAEDYERISEELSKLLQPSAKEKYPAFTFMQGHSRDYDLSAGLNPGKREWPFIRDKPRIVTTAGDFVLL